MNIVDPEGALSVGVHTDNDVRRPARDIDRHLDGRPVCCAEHRGLLRGAECDARAVRARPHDPALPRELRSAQLCRDTKATAFVRRGRHAGEDPGEVGWRLLRKEPDARAPRVCDGGIARNHEVIQRAAYLPQDGGGRNGLGACRTGDGGREEYGKKQASHAGDSRSRHVGAMAAQRFDRFNSRTAKSAARAVSAM